MAWKLPGFEQTHQLRSGSTGTVVVSRDQTTGTVVAVKYLSKNMIRMPGFMERFRHESRVLVGMENPHLAQLYDFVEGPDAAALITELVEGVSLRVLLDNGGPLDPEAALYVMKAVLLGLADVHKAGIVHRDIRPENILVDKNRVTKITDTGLAAMHRNAPAAGDPDYLAPEVWTGQPVSIASDVYAVGAMFFECVTGRPPRADNAPLGRAGLAEDEVAALLPEKLPERLRRFLSRQMAFQLAKRARHATAMLDELELAADSAYGSGWEEAGRLKLIRRLALLAEAPTGVLRPAKAGGFGSNDRGPRAPISRTRKLVAGALVIVLALVGLLVYSGVFSGGADAHSGAEPTFTHTPVAVIGPPMPSPPPPGTTTGDHVRPDRLNGLRVTGRSRTAVALVWNLGRDNVKVAGYLLLRDGQRVGTSYNPAFTDTGLHAHTRYSFAVQAFDAVGNLSPVSASVFAETLMAPDQSPPSVPMGLHSTGKSTTTIYLAWAASHDNTGVAGYDVFRDGVQVASVTQPNFIDTGLAPGTAHRYAVRSYDASNNASANSRPLSVSTLTLVQKDTTPPSTPTGLAATGTGVSTINVAWNASTDNIGVTDYLVYRDGTYLATVLAPATSYIDEGLAASHRYHYKVLARDAEHNASSFAGPVAGMTQDPPPPPTPTPSPTQTDAPPPTVVSIMISRLPVTIVAPACSTTVEATVTVSGPMSVELDYSVGGTNGSQSVSFAGAGAQTVTLGIGDGHADGSASVKDPVSGLTDSLNWTAPAECVPVVVTPTPTVNPDPTVSTGGGGGDGGGGTDGSTSGA